jgi:hypothetical protein
MVHKLVKIVRISVHSVNTVIHDELNLTRFSTHGVPKLLFNEQKERQVQILAQLLDHYESIGDPFLHSVGTCDET